MLNHKNIKSRNLEKIILIIPSLRLVNEQGTSYQCICGKIYYSHKSRLLNHIQNCRQIDLQLQRYQIRHSSAITQQSIIPVSFGISEQLFLDMQHQINLLNSKILTIRPQEVESLKNIQLARTYSNLFWKETALIIQNQLQTGFQEIFIEILSRKELPSGYFPQMKLKIISWINQLNFHQLVDDYRIQLEKAHKILIEQKKKSLSGQRSLEGYIRGYNFWSKFQTMRDYGKIINNIQQLKPRTKQEIFRYYKQITKLTKYPLPVIPYKIFVHRPLICVNKRKRPTIEDMRLLVTNLIQKGKTKIACDFWFCCSLGLRKRQMLRVKIQNDSGQFYDAINVLQKKNKHYCLRPIPMSLKKLIKKYNVDFPFTLKRIQIMKEIASKLNRRFYGYRSVCITQLISAFSQSLLQTHSSSSITQRYYLNQSSFSFINSFFKLPIIDNEPDIEQSKMYLRQTDNYDFIQMPLKQGDLLISIEDLINQMDPQEEQKEQIAISGVENIQIQEQISLQHRVITRFYQDYQIEFDAQSYTSIKQALSDSIEDRHFNNIYQVYFMEIQPTVSNLINFLNDVYHVDLYWLQISPNTIDNYPQSVDEKKENIIYLLEIKEECVYFRISSHQVKFTKTSKRSEFMSKRIIGQQSQSQFIKRIPKCTYCSRNLQYKNCNDHLYLTCNIHQISHQCLSIKERLRNKPGPLRFLSKNAVKIKSSISQASFGRLKNNIKQVIQKSLRLYTNQYIYYSTCFSGIINTKINAVVDDQTKKIILQNRQKQEYLPIKITNIDQIKGYGVLSTQFLKKDTLICSYLGCIGTNNNQMNGDDSQFACGFVTNNNNIHEIVIYSRQYANLGRYLNAPNEGEAANCRAEVVLIPKTNDMCQIGVIYITKKSIKPNEQLTVNYPSQIWNRIKNQEEMLQEKSTLARNINKFYQYFPLEFKQFILMRSSVCKNGRQNGDSSSQSEEEMSQQEDAQLNRLAPNIQPQLDNFFRVIVRRPLTEKISNYLHSFELKQKYFEYESIDKFSLIYSRIVQVNGDGDCLFRSITYQYFILYFEKACQFYFNINQDMDIFTPQMNFKKKQVGQYLKRLFKKNFRSSEQKWCDVLKKLLNERQNLDGFLSQKLRKACLKEIKVHFGRYQQFWSVNQIEKANEYLKKPHYQALQAIPFAISNALKLQINIWALSKNDLASHTIGEQYLNIVYLILIRQHYLIGINNNSLIKYQYFQKNIDKNKLRKSQMKLRNIEKQRSHSRIKNIKSKQQFKQIINQNEQIDFLPTVVANQEQLKNFGSYLKQLQQKYIPFGGVKIITSLKANINEILVKYNKAKINRYNQTLHRLKQGVYQYKNTNSSKSKSFVDFWSEAQDCEGDPKDITSKNFDQNFWENMPMKAQYSPDNNFEWCKQLKYPWNSEHADSLFSNIIKEKIIGINTPFLFIGKKGSYFGFHKEDYNLSAINYQLFGQPKVWYVLNQPNSLIFENYIKQMLKDYPSPYKCDQPLNHKDLIIDPYKLLKQGIKISKTFQRQGEIVIVFSNCYHSGFNMGKNINQAINFGNQIWLDSYLHFKNCGCGIIPQLQQDQMIKNLKILKEKKKQKVFNPIYQKFLRAKESIL